MSETRYTRQKGVELNKDNLVAILGQLIQSDYVEKFEVNLFEESLIVKFGDGSEEVFDYYDYLEITKDTIKHVGENNTTYTGYWLYNQDTLQGIYYADNVTSYGVDKKSKVIHINTEHKCHTMDMKRGVIVFDYKGDFVEVFKTDAPSLDFAMMKHGYKKVK